jgi:hypothetical protein
MNQAAERIESLKAGLVGAIAATGVFGIGILIEINRAAWFAQTGHALTLNLISLSTLFEASVALLSGFLFGVTYRYVVRNDRNSHLQSGAVLAFGLVRGLAQIDLSDTYSLAGFKLLSSLLLFGAAAKLLDWLMQRGWLKQF